MLIGTLAEKRAKARELRECVDRSELSAMTAAVARSRGYSCYLRECCDVIEASVLALGVPTSHHLISRLCEVCDGMDVLQESWLALTQARKEETSLQDDLVDGAFAVLSTFRERNDVLEKELRQFVQARDRRDAVLGEAADYVFAVMSEHAVWQEKHGYNANQLPIVEDQLSQMCADAIEAIQSARYVNQNGEGKQSTVTAGEKAKAPPFRQPRPSAVDNPFSIASRWKAAESVRHAAWSAPSSRLKYVPPQREVEILGDVLKDAAGRSALAKNLEEERTALLLSKERVRSECQRSLAALQQLRTDLLRLRSFMRDTVASKQPFLHSLDELVERMGLMSDNTTPLGGHVVATATATENGSNV